MEKTKGQANDWMPFLIMVLVEIGLAGATICYKIAVDVGMDLRVLVTYRLLFSAIASLALALIFERNSMSKLTWKVIFHAFLCGLFGGALAQNFYVESLALTSATYIAAMTNLVPATTFILAACFRLETLRIKTLVGKAKIFGTLLGIGGVMVLTFYKGKIFNISHTNLLKNGVHLISNHKDLIWGCLLALGNCLCNSLWYITQSKMGDMYPYEYTSTALMSFMGFIQAAICAISVQRDWTQWKLGWDKRLIITLYSGVVGFSFAAALIAWCIRMRDPVFVSAFNPLVLLIVAIVSSLLFNEKLHLGSIIGAIFIIGGLYVLLWGKSQEHKEEKQLGKVQPLEFDDSEIIITHQIDPQIP